MGTVRLKNDALYIASIGARTPLGRWRQAAAAVRCGVSAQAEHPFMIDKHVPDLETRRSVLGQVVERTGFPVPAPALHLVAHGHAGGLLALQNAVRQLRRRQVSLCLVGGADSYLDAVRLESLDGAGRLH